MQKLATYLLASYFYLFIFSPPGGSTWQENVPIQLLQSTVLNKADIRSKYSSSNSVFTTNHCFISFGSGLWLITKWRCGHFFDAASWPSDRQRLDCAGRAGNMNRVPLGGGGEDFWFGSHRAGCMRRPSFWNATEAQVGGWRNTRAKIRREYHSAGLRLHDNLTAVLFFSVETWMRGALLWLRFAVRQNYTAGSKKKNKKIITNMSPQPPSPPSPVHEVAFAMTKQVRNAGNSWKVNENWITLA